jgi:hypothetical protein
MKEELAQFYAAEMICGLEDLHSLRVVWRYALCFTQPSHATHTHTHTHTLTHTQYITNAARFKCIIVHPCASMFERGYACQRHEAGECLVRGRWPHSFVGLWHCSAAVRSQSHHQWTGRHTGLSRYTPTRVLACDGFGTRHPHFEVYLFSDRDDVHIADLPVSIPTCRCMGGSERSRSCVLICLNVYSTGAACQGTLLIQSRHMELWNHPL